VTGFQKIISAKKYTDLQYIVNTNDRGYILCGELSDTLVMDSSRLCIAKIDSSGNILWMEGYKNTILPSNYIIGLLNSGEILLAGDVDIGGPSLVMSLLKTSSTGNILWRKYYSTNGSVPLSLLQTKDNSYIISGLVNGIGAGNDDILLVKTDSSGNLKWYKTYGGIGNEAGYSLIEASDGGYGIVGLSDGFGSGNNDIYFVKTDSNGSLQWSKTYGGINDEAAFDVQQTSDGGYLLAGFTNSFGAGSYDQYILKTNSNGIVQWSKTFGGTSYDYIRYCQNCIADMNDRSYSLVGETHGVFNSAMDIILTNIDTLGNLNWSKEYGGSKIESEPDISSAHDGGLLISCITTSFHTNSQDAYIIKTDPLGNSGCNQMDVTNQIIVMNAPTITTAPATQVDSAFSQDSVSVTVVPQTWTEQTICSCSVTAEFAFSTNNSQLTCNNTSLNSSSWLWDFADGNNSALQNPIHTYTSNGTYKVCLTANDVGGCNDSTCHNININVGIYEEQNNILINIYPNPTDGIFTIVSEKIKSLEIVNVLGEKIWQQTKSCDKMHIDIDNNPKGVYFIKVQTAKGVAVKKIIIQ
jgi:hypothetical protein